MQTAYLVLLLQILCLLVVPQATRAFSPPSLGLGAVLFPVRGRIIQSVAETADDDKRLIIEDASDFFVNSFWTAKVGGGARQLSDRQRAQLRQSQVAEFTKRYGGRRQADLICCFNSNGEIVACAGIEVDSIPDGRLSAPRLEYAPLMSNLAVSRDYRRRGLAEVLVAAVEEQCRDWGYDHCYLYVEQRNVPAIRLYHKLGYERVWTDDTAQTLVPHRNGELRTAPTVILCMRKDLNRGGGLLGLFGRKST